MAVAAAPFSDPLLDIMPLPDPLCPLKPLTQPGPVRQTSVRNFQHKLIHIGYKAQYNLITTNIILVFSFFLFYFPFKLHNIN